ncbi:MAG: LysR substrate-binding domain-containing protein [Paenibacillus macerans]|uniref:LysR family transcriptional regulator n=1 Tax=Paenibacillus macerans TaxID=44252 RepID=UPI000EDE0481|nr:LysR substrate-binding domain-containing protein [Paenibacillus macerans]MDU7477571.1 LysR substrate-binding domain-containing protein [Paenibacillus macerans]UMV50502.1 LysR family transcriptional regulator [Paenibacillus macerans]GBK60539.1 LysR family transcriptional regulator [Paenibacillus macerans]GBK66839.1 LysR family transcriptional regulator [Paenibacillus macerans]
MELKQLEYFMAVCQELHFTRAAEKLGIAQPSLSQQIRLLEHEIGTPLFDRVGKRTLITEAGKTLLHHCYNIFHELSQARAAISELQSLNRGTLKIGTLLTVVNYLLPPTVIGFHRKYPNIELSVLGLRTGDIFEGLLKNELDLGIVYLPMEHEELEKIPLYKENLALAAPADHPVAKEPFVTLDILKETPSVLLPSSYFLRQLINEQCRALDIKPQQVLEMTTMESIINMVVQGVGVTILPKGYLDYIDNQQIRTIPIKSPMLTTEIGLVYRKNKYLCAASRVFKEQLLATLPLIQT